MTEDTIPMELVCLVQFFLKLINQLIYFCNSLEFKRECNSTNAA